MIWYVTQLCSLFSFYGGKVVKDAPKFKHYWAALKQPREGLASPLEVSAFAVDGTSQPLSAPLSPSLRIKIWTKSSSGRRGYLSILICHLVWSPHELYIDWPSSLPWVRAFDIVSILPGLYLESDLQNRKKTLDPTLVPSRLFSTRTSSSLNKNFTALPRYSLLWWNWFRSRDTYIGKSCS